MTPTLAVSPNPAPPNTRVRVDGTGFGKYRVRLRLDGELVAQPIRPDKAGTFHLGVDVGMAGSSVLVAEQFSVKRWSEVARVTVTVAEPAPPPPPPPPPDPTPTPKPFPYASLQAAIDATPAGGTLQLPNGRTFAEAVRVPRKMTIDFNGAIIDGTGKPYWISVESSDVTLLNPICHDANTPIQDGAIRFARGTARGRVTGGDLSRSNGAGITFGVANQTVVENVKIHDNGQLGVHLGGDGTNGRDNILRGCEIARNNIAKANDPAWEAGGMKGTKQTNLLVEGNDVHDNWGPGLWLDIYAHGTVYRANRVHDNAFAGIFEEVSYDGLIEGNIVYRNGRGDWRGWGWPAGILVSSSTRTIVRRNVVAFNKAGISVISQSRSGDWPLVHPLTGISVMDNDVIGATGEKLLGWFQDWSGALYSGENTGSANRYFGNGAFEWANKLITSLAEFNGTPGEEGGTYMTTTQRDALLAKHGITA